VVKSARVMKQAVAYLQPYMEAARRAPPSLTGGGDATDGGRKARIVLATVKGDVHDIGKNIVGVVLACNNYEVIDLGVMVPCERILATARERGAAIIGLSGLITPSLDEMVHVAGEMRRQGFTLPLLIGGATTSAAHTALKIAPQYDHPVVHVPDASRVVGVVAQLLNPQTRDSYARAVAAEQERRRQEYLGRHDRPLLSLAEARANRFPTDWAAAALEPPAFLGTCVLAPIPLALLAEYVDWTPFFHVWELRGRYPDVLDDPTYGEEARRLYRDARALLDEIIAHGWLEARGVYGFWPAQSQGDDILVYPHGPEHPLRVVLHTLRQQVQREGGRPNLALADYIAPVSCGRLDYIGGFVVTAGHGLDHLVAHYEARHDDYTAILARALADRLAEAGAEYLHAEARRHWYAPHEQLTNTELIRERYRGIRPAPGYPAQPDHTEKRTLFALLGAEAATSVALTETCAMLPGSSVCGLYFGHPAARYFAVGRIGRDQVEDYAARKGMLVTEVERWLAPNLAYDPTP